MSARTTLNITLVVSVVALGIALLALFLPINAASTTTTTIIVDNTGTLPSILSLYDNSAQASQGANQWTNVVFNTPLFTSSAWIYAPGSTNVFCNRSALYSVYFGIQAQLTVTTTPPSETPFACMPCYMRYMIRATQTRQSDTTTLLEVPGSLTYANGESLFLGKQFFLNAEVGDLFQFQFLSTCPQFTLYPLALLQPTLPEPVQDLFPSSAVLLIS